MEFTIIIDANLLMASFSIFVLISVLVFIYKNTQFEEPEKLGVQISKNRKRSKQQILFKKNSSKPTIPKTRIERNRYALQLQPVTITYNQFKGKFE